MNKRPSLYREGRLFIVPFQPELNPYVNIQNEKKKYTGNVP